MGDSNAPSRPEAATPSPAERLDSWKEIAAYLRRDERTVRRWQKIGLPVHRHVHKRKATVFAYKVELDAWWNNGRNTVALQGQQTSRPWIVAGAAVLGCALLAVGAVWWRYVARRQPAAPSLEVSTVVTLPGWVGPPIFSPDGNQIAFLWGGEDKKQSDIYVKRIGGGAPLRVTQTPVNEYPVGWSPDGRQITFARQTAAGWDLFVMPALGGPERKLAHLNAQWQFDVRWHPDGKTIAVADRNPPDEPYSIYQISVDTLERRRLTTPSERGLLAGDRIFEFSPDGARLAYVRSGSKNTLYLAALPVGEPRAILSENASIGNLAWTADGRAIVFSSDRHGSSKLWRIPASGGLPELLPYGENASSPAIALHGNRLAFVRLSSDTDLGRLALASPAGPVTSSSPLANSNREEAAPQLSPDGSRVAFSSDRSGSTEMWVANADGSQPRQLTSLRSSYASGPAWSPDGRQISFSASANPPHSGPAVYVIQADGSELRRLTDVQQDYGGFPAWSHDGSWIYATRTGAQEGRPEIWKIPVRGGTPIQITRDGGWRAQESPDGRFLYFTKMAFPGLWRISTRGGEEQVVLAGLLDQKYSGYIAIVSDGIYFLNIFSKPSPEIQFLGFASRKISRVAPLPGEPSPWDGGFTVSRDRRFIVYSHVLYLRRDIMLVENFR